MPVYVKTAVKTDQPTRCLLPRRSRPGRASVGYTGLDISGSAVPLLPENVLASPMAAPVIDRRVVRDTSCYIPLARAWRTTIDRPRWPTATVPCPRRGSRPNPWIPQDVIEGRALIVCVYSRSGPNKVEESPMAAVKRQRDVKWTSKKKINHHQRRRYTPARW